MRVLWLLPVLFLASFAQADDEEVRAGIERLFESFQEAANAEDGAAFAALWDPDSVYEALKAQKIIERLPEAAHGGFEQALSTTLRPALARRMMLEPHDEFQIRRITPGARRGTYVVYVRHRTRQDLLVKLLWSVVAKDDGWYAYDVVELDTNLGFSSMLGVAIASALSTDLSRWRIGGRVIEQVRDMLLEERFAEALLMLEEVEDAGLPTALEAVRLLMLGMCHLGLEDVMNGLRSISAAEDLRSDMPVVHYLRAVAYNSIERYDAALAAARKYVEVLDADGDVLLEIGTALLGLERDAEAVGVLQEGLKDNPRNADLVAMLALALPIDRKGEIGPHLQRLPDLVENFEYVCELVLAEEDAPALRALVDAYRPVAQEDPQLGYYQAQWLKLSGRYEEAAKTVLALFARVKDTEDRYAYYLLHLDAMIELGKPVEAYQHAPDREYAFTYLATYYSELGEVELLTRIVETAAKQEPEPSRLAFFQAEVDWLARRYAKVVERLRPLAETIEPAQPYGEDETSDEAWEHFWEIEDRLIRSYVRSKQLDEALRLAETVDQRDGDAQYLVLVHAVKGEVAKAIAAAERFLGEQEYDPTHLFDDEDMGPLLKGDAYKELRERFAPETFGDSDKRGDDR